MSNKSAIRECLDELPTPYLNCGPGIVKRNKHKIFLCCFICCQEPDRAGKTANLGSKDAPAVGWDVQFNNTATLILLPGPSLSLRMHEDARHAGESGLNFGCNTCVRQQRQQLLSRQVSNYRHFYEEPVRLARRPTLEETVSCLEECHDS